MVEQPAKRRIRQFVFYMKTIILFFASLATVFLINLQTLNVVGYNYALAFVTSALISWSSYYLFKLIPDGMKWYEFIAYIIGGAVGAVLGMYIYGQIS